MAGICISGDNEYDTARNKYISYSDFVKNEPQFFKKRIKITLPFGQEIWFPDD